MNKQTKQTNDLFLSIFTANLATFGVAEPEAAAAVILASINSDPRVGIYQNKAAVAEWAAAAAVAAPVELTNPVGVVDVIPAALPDAPFQVAGDEEGEEEVVQAAEPVPADRPSLLKDAAKRARRGRRR